MEEYNLEIFDCFNFDIQGQSLDSLSVKCCHMMIIPLMYMEKII
ncbi:MAG: hypothetical protein MAG458_01748 [Nitrosopumilus sp.]|nr:hypothetical protein [Nitrosopumilus sp.]